MKSLEKIKQVFFQALEKESDEEREAYLNETCQNDPSLRVEINALLKGHFRTDSFIKGPILDHEVSLDNTSLSEIPGTVIGRYKLLEKIGEGGMAVVYMAEQTEPIHRKVALKIIKLGMDTKSVIARFEAERQALAMMDHPNIAKVLDAGSTETGRPYFVMELVTGVSITEYCDKNKLSTKERLVLFIEVCNAVQHAHQKGIIHRDIKPTNVMVSQHEGQSIPKVIDFGIAKATNQRLTEKTLFTRYAHIIGTPAYMSPEQADLGDLDVDTRSDIYSLGVLLYELLTGATPFSEEELRKAGYIEMQRIIREQDPPKPSSKLSTLGETLTDIAKHHGCTPNLLRKTIRGDLDWIVMKNLEKARDRRYDTVSSLISDIRRYLKNKPVLAHAPSRIYCLRKFSYRHRSSIVIALCFVVSLSALIMALSLWNQKQLEHTKAEIIEHENILSQAVISASSLDPVIALQSLRSILDSKHVGHEAKLLYENILINAKAQIINYTSKIEANPKDTDSYLRRAQYYLCLNDNDKVCADMEEYSSLLNPPKGSDAYSQWIENIHTQDSPSGFNFGTPTNLGPTINTSFVDIVSWISPNELELYICSDRPGGYGSWDIWKAIRTSKGTVWKSPVNLGPNINSPQDEGPAFISPDGLKLYFGVFGKIGGHGSCDIWVSSRASLADSWDPPTNLSSIVNSQADEVPYSISSDGLELYFADCYAVARQGGLGNRDIWVTKRKTVYDPWSKPDNLGSKVNSPFNDFTPVISNDGLSLLFTVTNHPGGHGNDDIWISKRVSFESTWSEPINLGPPVNSVRVEALPILCATHSTLYFCSDRPGGFGREDIWQVPIIRFENQGK